MPASSPSDPRSPATGRDPQRDPRLGSGLDSGFDSRSGPGFDPRSGSGSGFDSGRNSAQAFSPRPVRRHRRSHGRRSGPARWLRRVATVLAVLSVCALTVWLARYAYLRAPLYQERPVVELRVARGASAQSVANAVRDGGIELNPWWFLVVAKLRGDIGRLKAGFYRIESPVTLRALLDRLASGQVSLNEIRFGEGWTFAQLRAALAARTDLARQLPGLTDAALLERIGAPESHPEGLFAPDTYRFEVDSSDLALLERAYTRQKQVLAQAWEKRREGLPYRSAYQALIVASIIEKETGSESERAMVAAVFVNRLRKGMLLQSDPTTIYGLGAEFDGDLRRRDLRRDTPYNTYTRAGLPPTPISMPGRASIEAALNPAESDVLYFVSRGDGSSEFSLDLRSHNRAVDKYQRRR